MNKLIVAIIGIFIFASCTPKVKRYEFSGFTQGSTYKVVYYSTEASIKQYEINDLLSEFSKSCSLFDSTSLLTKINNNITDSADCHIIACEKLARHIYEVSEGAYDITSAPLSEAYGFLRKKEINSVNVDSILAFVGHDKLSIVDGKVIKKDSRIAMNLNSIAQGYSVDLVSKFIASKGINNYLVEIGGEVYCSGTKDGGKLWRIGIDKPIDGNMIQGVALDTVLTLKDKGLNTSGNYRKFHIKDDGKRVNHILDPRTGLSSSNDMLSATVVADNTAIADGYATMLMVLGSEKSIKFLEESKDITGYIIYNKNNKIEIFSTIK